MNNHDNADQELQSRPSFSLTQGTFFAKSTEDKAFQRKEETASNNLILWLQSENGPNITERLATLMVQEANQRHPRGMHSLTQYIKSHKDNFAQFVKEYLSPMHSSKCDAKGQIIFLKNNDGLVFLPRAPYLNDATMHDDIISLYDALEILTFREDNIFGNANRSLENLIYALEVYLPNSGYDQLSDSKMNLNTNSYTPKN